MNGRAEIFCVLVAVFCCDLSEMIAHCGQCKTVGNVAGIMTHKIKEIFPKLPALAVANTER